MKVPFRIRKVVESAPATGLLLWSDDSAELLALLAALDADPLPPVFAVAGGYLVKLAAQARCAFPSVTRLRRLADDLFLPVDAVLLPALFNDEAEGLVRKRGLVFLPGGRVLGYDPTQPVELGALLTITRVRRRAWHAPPQLPERADRLRSIVFDRPNDTPDELLIPDGPPIGTEEPRPENAGFFSRLSGKAVLGAGMGIVWLGKLFGWKGLAKLGGWSGAVRGAVGAAFERIGARSAGGGAYVSCCVCSARGGWKTLCGGHCHSGARAAAAAVRRPTPPCRRTTRTTRSARC